MMKPINVWRLVRGQGEVGDNALAGQPANSNPDTAGTSGFVSGMSRWKPSRGFLMLSLSFVFGLTGVFYSRSYIETQIEVHRASLNQKEAMLMLVVPNRDLSRGEPLVAQDLSVREIPAKYADTNALTQASYESALGQQLAFDIEEGRPLLWAHLQGGRSPTFSGMVPNGSRALTVRVDEINSISGFLQPSDKIDLLLSHGHGLDNVVVPLLDNLVVIATGVQTQVIKNGEMGQRSFSTITINVSPDDAKKITLAQQIGRLTAVLRNPEDDIPLANSPITIANLLGLPKPAQLPKKPKAKAKVRPPKPPTIEYIIGGV